MHPLITLFLLYLSGVFVMAFIVRYENAKEESKQTCLYPSFSLLSWIGVAIYVICILEESYKNGFIAKLFNYTDKE